MSDISDSLFCAGLACATDLLPVQYQRRLPKKGVSFNELPTEDAERRPGDWEIEIYSFPQTWSSTALGFDRIGGAAMTTAQTTIVLGPRGDAAVYFGKRLAYRINRPNSEFMKDMCGHGMAACGKQGKYNAA